MRSLLTRAREHADIACYLTDKLRGDSLVTVWSGVSM